MLIKLLDVNGMFHPIWRFHEAKGNPPGTAAEECVRLLRQAASAGDADYVVACCDSPNCFRAEIAKEYRALVPDYVGYKGDRAAKEPALLAALDRVISEIEQDGVPIMRADGFEADDVIATITEWATAQGHDVVIHSEDKDLLSNVVDPDPENESAPSVVVVRRDGTRQNGDACVARLGVPPSLVAEFLALHGDKSDGVLGIPDVGKVWATKLLWGEYDAQKQWQPTPFKNFDAIVAAAVEEQAEVERAEREKVCKRVHTGAKRGATDAQIAAKLNITLDDVARFKAMPEPPKMPDVKTYFAENVRKGIISHADSFGIGLRLTRLRTDVPLDFAQVTAPRVSPKDPAKEAEMAALLNEGHAEAEEEERHMAEMAQRATEGQTMQTTIPDAEFTDVKPPTDRPSEPRARVAPDVKPEPATSNMPPAQATFPAEHSASVKPAAPEPKRDALAVVVPERPFNIQLEPRNPKEADWLAKCLFNSRQFKDLANVEAAYTKLAVGRSMGLTLYQSLSLHMFQGRIVKPAMMIVAQVRQHPACEFFRKRHGDARSAIWETKRKGDPRIADWEFTIEEARDAGLVKADSGWAKYPKNMCSWRSATFLAREEWAEVVGDFLTPEEVADIRGGSIDTIGEAA